MIASSNTLILEPLKKHITHFKVLQCLEVFSNWNGHGTKQSATGLCICDAETKTEEPLISVQARPNEPLPSSRSQRDFAPRGREDFRERERSPQGRRYEDRFDARFDRRDFDERRNYENRGMYCSHSHT